MTIGVALLKVHGASDVQRTFIETAISRLREAIAAPGFLPAIRQGTYVESRWTPLHGQWRSLTGDEIAERIALGIERGTDPGDGVLQFAFELKDLPGPETGHQTLGSTSLGCQPIHPSRWFVERCRMAGDAVNLASHFMHEWMHVSGFYHWPDNKARGDAAYVAGRIVRETLETKYASEVDASITALMHDKETDCGCRGNPEGGAKVGQN